MIKNQSRTFWIEGPDGDRLGRLSEAQWDAYHRAVGRDWETWAGGVSMRFCWGVSLAAAYSAVVLGLAMLLAPAFLFSIVLALGIGLSGQPQIDISVTWGAAISLVGMAWGLAMIVAVGVVELWGARGWLARAFVRLKARLSSNRFVWRVAERALARERGLPAGSVRVCAAIAEPGPPPSGGAAS